MKYYSIKEAANIMNVSYSTIYNLVQSKKISTCKVGRNHKIPHAILYNYANEVYKPFIESGLDIDIRLIGHGLKQLEEDKDY